MLIENLSFPEALRRVAEKVGITLRELTGNETLDANARDRAALYKIHEVAAKFFAEQLSGTVEGRAARGYLADRGLSDEVIGRFRLGYAPAEGRGLTRRLSEADVPTGLLEKSGLVLRATEGDRHFDRFRRRIIFPIANESGKLVAFGGRALGDEQPKYLNSPETPIYTKSRVLYHLERAANAIRRLDRAILVEGYMDCIAVASAGFENVVASCGTSLTESQVRLLGRHSRRVVVNYDPDSAGLAATERSLALLLEDGFQAQVLALPEGQDPDSFIRRQGADAYRKLLEAAPSYLDYLTERAASQHDLATPEGKVEAANAVMPYLAKVPNPILRKELASRLADRLRVDDRLFRAELNRAAERRREMTPSPQLGSTKVNHSVKLLLRACVEDEASADEFAAHLVESGDCAGLIGEKAFRSIAETRRRGEKIVVAQLAESLDSEERRLLFDSLFWEGKPSDREAESARLVLRREKIERDLKNLRSELAEAIKARDSKRIGEVEQAKFKLEKELTKLRSSSDPSGALP
jgi:DNA primase